MHASVSQRIFRCVELIAALVFFLLIKNDGQAQNSNQIFEHLTTENGLSSNKVEAVIQDRDGFYWIATQNGLNRYDGTTFKIYRHQSNDSTSLTDNYCTALQEGTNGDIWVSTYKGINRFVKANGSFQQIYLRHQNRNFEITNRVYDMVEDLKGNLWIAGNGLWKYDVQMDSVVYCFTDMPDSSASQDKGLITHLIFDQENNGLWFSNGSDVFFYSIDKNEFYYKRHNPLRWVIFDEADGAELALDRNHGLWFRNLESQSLSFFEFSQNRVTHTSKKVSKGIKQLFTDEKGMLWIFYWLGRSEIYHPLTAVTDTGFFAFHHHRSIISERANSLYIDHHHNYWISTDLGIGIYNEGNQYYKIHTLANKYQLHLPGTITIKAMAQTQPDILWIATDQGLYKYDLPTGIYPKINIQIPITNITTLCPDEETIWIGVYDHIYQFDTKSESVVRNIHLTPGIFFIRKGAEDDLWVGLWTGGLYRIYLKTGEQLYFRKNKDEASSLKSNNLITGFLDHSDFWIGYNAGIGFSKYSMLTDSFIHLHPQQNDLSNWSAGTITVITKDPDEKLWLGTHGGGVLRFDPVTGTFKVFLQEHALNSNYINSIIPDDMGNLWISTADGMNYYNGNSHTLRHLDMDLVFPDNDFVPNGINGVNDKIYFFCKNEFVEIAPYFFHPDLTFPQLVLTNFKVFDRDVPFSADQKKITLSYNENFFSFEYSAIRSQSLHDVQYAYLLEGFDKEWNHPDDQLRANYTNVPEGNYSFQVKVTNDDGQWSETLIDLPVHIRPPFWHTWWFILLCITAIITTVYAIYKNRVQQLQKIFSMRTKISQDLHDDIGGTLSSIHIYSTVAEKEVSGNPEKAKLFLRQINTNSREVMENISDIVWANNTNHEQETSLAARIKNYGYDLLSQKNIQCIYDLDIQAERKLTKPEARRSILLIIKEALNNMAKYSNASLAEIHLSVKGSDLVLDIADNGKGFHLSKENIGNGLNHMKQRATSLGGSFSFTSSPGQGTSLHCRIPLTNISDR